MVLEHMVTQQGDKAWSRRTGPVPEDLETQTLFIGNGVMKLGQSIPVPRPPHPLTSALNVRLLVWSVVLVFFQGTFIQF